MKRPMLVSGIVLTVAFALITSIPKSAAVILAVSVLVLFLSLFKKIRKNVFVPTIGICLLLSVIFSFAFYKAKIEPCIPYHNTSCNLQGKVISSPEADGYGNVKFIIETTEIDGEDIKHKIEIFLSEGELDEIKLFDEIYIRNAELSIPLDHKLDYDFTSVADGTLLTGYTDEVIYLSDADRTPYYYCLRLKELISDRIDFTMNDESGALLKGMLFGDKNGLSYETSLAFRSSGIAHLLAVSGLHTALWCGLILSVLKALKAKERTSAVVCIIFLVGFVIISAFTPSVIRASLMMVSVLIAPLFNRKGDSLNSLGLAITLILVSNPYNALSISFQLSAVATFGVLCSMQFQEKLFSATCRHIHLEPLRRLVNSLLASVCVSIFASIFTLPVSAYHFGVFNLLSPVGNILCVTLAFYGMIFGFVGIGVSFIPTAITKALSFALINLTEFILDLVTAFAKTIGNISIATVPVHKSYLLLGLVVIALVISIGYVIYKKKFENKYFKGAVAVLSLAVLATSILVPLTVPPYKTTLTVVSSGNNLYLIIRDGTDYAYIVNASDSAQNEYDYLPKATCEVLKYYIPTYLSGHAFYDIERVGQRYSPREVRVSDYMYRACISNGYTLPANTIIEIADKYVLSDEITFEIIDTYSIKYVIIKSNEKSVFVHLSGELDTKSLQYIKGCDTIVTNSTVPSVIPNGVDTVIISADATALSNPDIKYVQNNCNEFYVTARSGTVQIPL